MERKTGGGLWLMALAALFFAVMSLLVRLAGERLPSPQIVFFRAALTLVFSYLLVRRARLSPWVKSWRLLLLRGLLGFGALSCFYWSLTHLPLAEATVIQYTNPVFTAVIAALVLKERMRGVEVLGVLTCLAGVVLVARPQFLFGGGPGAPLPLASVGVALLGALFSACAYVAVRKTGETEHALVVVLWFPLLATPMSLPLAVTHWVPPGPVDWLLLLGVGVVTQTAQTLMTHGLHREPAGRATAVSYLQIVFAVGLGVVFLGESPDLFTLGGALMIGAGVMAVAFWPKRPLPVTAAADPASASAAARDPSPGSP